MTITAQTALLGDRTVQRIGFGAMQLAGPGVFGPPKDPDAARAVLRRAIELGVNHIDTAQFYGPDVVNDLIGETLHPYPGDLVFATKVGGARNESGGWIGAQRPEQLKAGVEANLRSLKLEKIDLVNLRRMDEHAGVEAVPLAEQLGALIELRDEGKLDLIGISTVTREVVEEALKITPIAQVQNAFSVVNRKDEPTLELCREQGIAYVPYFPLGSAFSGGPKALAADPAIAGVAEKHGVSASQVALAWLLAQFEQVLLIPGTSSVAHLEENLSVGSIVLDDEDLAALDEATQLGDPTPPAH